MENNIFGEIVRINGHRIIVKVVNNELLTKLSIMEQSVSFITIGSLIGTKLIDNRTLILTIDEIYFDIDYFISCSISGIYDEAKKEYKFGTNSYPLIKEKVFLLNKSILADIFVDKNNDNYIGTYFYNKDIKITYDPNVIFGKHLGVFGNTGSGKTCTVVSLIQNYIRNNRNKDIKFLVLDVNGEYKSAFNGDEYLFIDFNDLKIPHTNLDIFEYGKLFAASEGIQFPALRDCINNLSKNGFWDLKDLGRNLRDWIDKQTPRENNNKPSIFYKNQLGSYLNTLLYRIDGICNDDVLMSIINRNDESGDILELIKSTDKKVIILNLQVSNDALDIILFLLFKVIYKDRAFNVGKNHKYHLSLVLEEAHRYININVQETKLGSYYIDKLAREGRKFGIGLVISSQVPSMLAYEVVSQCNSVIMHKITSNKDMEFLRGVMRISNESFYLQMSSLEKQYAIICGEAFKNDTIVKVNNAKPLPKSNDPVIMDL